MPTVGVHDDLAAGESGVAHRPADNEASGGIDVIFGVSVEQVGWEIAAWITCFMMSARRVFVGDGLGVLRRDDDRVNADRLVDFRRTPR